MVGKRYATSVGPFKEAARRSRYHSNRPMRLNLGRFTLEPHALMQNFMIPSFPIIQDGEEPFAMFRDLKRKYGTWIVDTPMP